MATKIARYHSNHRPSSDTQALMVKIDWTDAKVVKVTARRRLTLQAATVSIIRGIYTVIARQQMPVGEGMTIHFVPSDEFKGWYYICLQQHDGSFACTCPRASKFHLACHHQHDAASFEARRVYRQALPIFFQQIAMWATLSFYPISREIAGGDKSTRAAYWTARNAYGDYRRAHAELFVIPPPITVDDLGELEAIA